MHGTILRKRSKGIVTDVAKIPKAKFGAVVSDPPWDWAAYGRKGKGRSAEAHYDVMNIEDIKLVPVGSWVKEDAVLFLWVHNSMLQSGLDVMNAWGFNYKSVGFLWLKCYPGRNRVVYRPTGTIKEITCRPAFGQGKWTRLSTETCLLGTRGKPRVMSNAVHQLIVTDRREHSRKPEEIYPLVERLVKGPYLELFGSYENKYRPGWTRWIAKDRAEFRRWASNSYPME